jgi:ABC-type lipoprotein release transport system permease subunit
MIEFTKRHSEQFPIGLEFDGGIQVFSLEDAKRLRMELSDAIEWAVNMEDIRKEKRYQKEINDKLTEFYQSNRITLKDI